jgi:drug/metabolite transporter (DMT)-like permease
MLRNPSPHTRAVAQALFVTFLWSTSWLIVKVGLVAIPALTFAGLRYTLACVCLLPFMLRANLADVRRLTRVDWARLAVLGLLFIAVTQGAVFVGLAYLPAVTVNLLLNFSSVAVALLGIVLLGERPTLVQWGGMALNVLGVLIYFYPSDVRGGDAIGLIVVAIGVLANALSSILGRSVNRARRLHPLVVTTVSIGIGGVVLLGVGIAGQGLPRLEPLHWSYVAWLAIVNTAFAFTLWNHTLRTLSAMESSIINGSMLVQIPILAVLFLGEHLSAHHVAGMVLAGAGALVVQLRSGGGNNHG